MSELDQETVSHLAALIERLGAVQYRIATAVQNGDRLIDSMERERDALSWALDIFALARPAEHERAVSQARRARKGRYK